MRKSFPIAACSLGLLSLGAYVFVPAQPETNNDSLRESLHAGISVKELKVPVGHKMLSFPIREKGKVIADRANQGRATIRRCVNSIGGEYPSGLI